MTGVIKISQELELLVLPIEKDKIPGIISTIYNGEPVCVGVEFDVDIFEGMSKEELKRTIEEILVLYV